MLVQRGTMEFEPPLVGREEEIETIVGCLGDALSGSGSLVLISGEAGIGKTRVLETAMVMAKKSGFQVAIGRCIPGAPSPCLPFYEAFSTLAENPFAEGSREEGMRMRLNTVFFNVLDFLIKESARQPLIICIEDLLGRFNNRAAVTLPC